MIDLKKWVLSKYSLCSNLVIEEVENVALRKSELRKYAIFDSQTGICGTMVLPKPNNEKKFILLSNKLNADEYVETLAHEITHLNQYLLFAQRFCNGDYEKIQEDKDWLIFFYWSEYSAKKEGLLINYEYKRDILRQHFPVLNNDDRNFSLLWNRINDEPQVFLYDFFRALARVNSRYKCTGKWYEEGIDDRWFLINKYSARNLLDALPAKENVEDLKLKAEEIRRIIKFLFNIALE